MATAKTPAKRAAKATPATQPPIPGQVWKEHKAIYIGIQRSADGKSAWHLLLPVGAKFQIKGAYGCYGKKIVGADCRFDGNANTLAMAKASSQTAAKALALHGDCYIPSRAESALLYAVAPDEFKTDDWYLTSTQYSENNAWMQHFAYGYQYTNRKSDERRCRFVRRLPLQSFNPLDSVAAA